VALKQFKVGAGRFAKSVTHHSIGLRPLIVLALAIDFV
jgi:hypothetical protein